jgi:hypothetical protein
LYSSFSPWQQQQQAHQQQQQAHDHSSSSSTVSMMCFLDSKCCELRQPLQPCEIELACNARALPRLLLLLL